jgi:hypothetical protein
MKAGREHRGPLSSRCLEIVERGEEDRRPTACFLLVPPAAHLTPRLSVYALFVMLLRRLRRDEHLPTFPASGAHSD